MARSRKTKMRPAKNLYPTSEKGHRVALTRALNKLKKALERIARLEEAYAELVECTKAASRAAKKAARA